MKKVCFCLEQMNLGGTEKALLEILKKFDLSKYDITLVILRKSDKTVMEKIPKNIKIICYDTSECIKYLLENKRYIDIIKLRFEKIFKIRDNFQQNIYNLGKFDYGVSFSCFTDDSIYHVIDYIEAEKKYTWMHFELKKANIDPRENIDYLKQYNKIIGVSKKVTEELNELCPELKNNTITCYNIIDTEEIIVKSKDLSNVEEEFLNNKNIKLLSVGRLAKQKGYDIGIETAKLLKENNINFTWYVVGEGDEHTYLQNLINKYNLEKEFILLGRKDNPYPYINNCDLFVQPSRFEAYSLTMLEAKVLKKPIIATNFAGADEQIENGVDGIIVNDMEPKSIYDAIIKFIENEDFKNSIIENISDLDNETNWKKIEDLFKN